MARTKARTFDWLRADGPLRCEDMAQIVSELFLHGAIDGAFAPRAASPRSRSVRGSCRKRHLHAAWVSQKRKSDGTG